MHGWEARAQTTHSEELQAQHLDTHLLEVSILDELHSLLCVLQVHSLTHAGLGVGCGQANQGFQGPGCHWRRLRGENRGNHPPETPQRARQTHLHGEGSPSHLARKTTYNSRRKVTGKHDRGLREGRRVDQGRIQPGVSRPEGGQWGRPFPQGLPHARTPLLCSVSAINNLEQL